MTADTLLSQELKSLHDELYASHQQRSSPPAGGTRATEDTAGRDARPEDEVEEQGMQGQLRELVNAIKEFAEEAGKNVSAHPAANVIGALVVGILIGRLLGRH